MSSGVGVKPRDPKSGSRGISFALSLLVLYFILGWFVDEALAQPETLGRAETFAHQLSAALQPPSGPDQEDPKLQTVNPDQGAAGTAKSPPAEAQEAPNSRGSLRVMPQKQFYYYAEVGLLTYGSYRHNATRLAVLGLGLTPGLLVTARQCSCLWVDKSTGARTNGTMSYLATQEHHRSPWAAALLFCDLPANATLAEQGKEEASGSHSRRLLQDGAGVEGVASRVDEHQRILQEAASGQRMKGAGYLELHLGELHLLAHEEEEPPVVHSFDSKGPFAYDVVFCSAPVYGRLHDKSISQWMDYHVYYAGYEHMFFYDAGAEGDVVPSLARFVEAGLLTIVDWRGQVGYETWYGGQVMAIQECLYRNAHQAAWVSYHDVDEYLQLMFSVPTTLPEFLRTQLEEHPQFAWFSHGTFFMEQWCVLPRGGWKKKEPETGEEEWGAQTLVTPSLQDLLGDDAVFLTDEEVWGPQQQLFAVEMIPVRPVQPHCRSNDTDAAMCLRHLGHRKTIINPRKVVFMNIHHPFQLVTGTMETSGRDLNAYSELRHAHFAHFTAHSLPLNGKTEQWCNPTLPMAKNQPVPGTVDLGVVLIASRARECALKKGIPTFQCK